MVASSTKHNAGDYSQYVLLNDRDGSTGFSVECTALTENGRHCGATVSIHDEGLSTMRQKQCNANVKAIYGACVDTVVAVMHRQRPLSGQ